MTILVIDAGSSSVRTLQFDDDLRPIPGAIHRIEHRFTPDAAADPAHLRSLIELCLDRALDSAASAPIRAVGMAVFVGNLLGVDAEGTPVTPLLTYADVRSSDDADHLRAQYDLATVHSRTGCRIHPAYHPAKLSWLRRTQPDSINRVHRWIDLATYCYESWFGRPMPCSYSVASWSGLLNRRSLTWDETWLAELGLSSEQFPALADFNQVQRGLTPELARRWPALRDIPFYLAVGDGAAANIGTGGIDARHPVLTIGTTAAIRIVSTDPGSVDPGLWAYRVDAQRHLIGGATSEGGSIFAWARDNLRLDLPALDDALAQRMPGAHGLMALPLLAGERSPGYRGDAVGIIHGLRLNTTALDVLHALLEGVALRLRIIYDLLGRPGASLLASGGALTQSPAWAQIVADTLGTPLHLVDVPEATALGVACLIAGTAPDIPEESSRLVNPRPNSETIVESLLADHQRLYRLHYPADG